MIFLKIFRSEFTYLAGRVSTWLYLLVLLIFTMGLGMIISTNDGVYLNNTFHITATSVIGGLIWLLIGASVAGEAAARDVQLGIHPLVYTTPVSRQQYLGGKFLAAFVVNALLMLSLPLGLLLSFYLPGLPRMGEGELLPFRPEAYLNVYFLITLPIVFFGTALQFSFAALSRKVMTAYLAGFLLAIFPQLIAVSVAELSGNWDLTVLLDPVGVAGIIGNEMQTWTITEKNTRLISPEGIFLWNRILWLCLATGLLLLTLLRFKFSGPSTISRGNRFKRKPKVEAENAARTGIIRATGIVVPQVQQNFGFATEFRQMLRIARASFVKIAKHPIGLTLIAAIALASAMFGDLIINEFGIPLLPTTQQVLAYLAAPVSNIGSPWVMIPLLIIYFVGELVWQEREAGMADVADVTPSPDWVIFTGKFLGLCFIILVWMTLLMLGGILLQIVMGYHEYEIGLYVKVLFGIQLIAYLLFALLSHVVHVVVNQKHIAYLVVLLIFGFMAFPAKFGIEHPLLIFGADPGWTFSDMRGFGNSVGPWLWFQLYWMAWAVLLTIAGSLLWPRGREQRFKNRLQRAQRSFTGPAKRTAIISSGLVLAVGSFIYYNTNVLNQYLSTSDNIERKADYERRYGRHRNTPQPVLTATKLEIELYPDRQEVDVRGSYTLVNKGSIAIDSIHLGNASGIAPAEVNVSWPAKAVGTDKDLAHYIYALEQPLRPGDSIQLNFMLKHRPEGFGEYGINSWVVKNGTYFTNFDLLPVIGYQRNREIHDAVLRKKSGLAARPALPSLYDPEARKKPFSADETRLEVIIGTAKDEIAVAPGALQQTWTEGERKYFHYKTDASVGAEYSILSAAYKVKESRWNDVVIRLYYHPQHDRNIEKMLQSAKASLEYYSEQFGPYPYDYLTIIERAGPGSGGTADAGIIYYGEQFPLLNPDDSPEGLDLPYYILAHEVAHQWWGMARLTPAQVEGAGVLIEGLSVYSGMQVLEKTYGKAHLQKYVDYLHSSYALPRSLASASLLQADEEFLYYRKGGIAMHALSEYIGRENVNAALKNLLEKRTSGALPLPTTLDLYRELAQVTPDSLTYLLNDLFRENTYWRLKTKSISAEETAAGNWEVTLKVQVEKFVVDHTGKEKDVPMNDWLEIGLFGDKQSLYLEMHRIRSGEQVIKVTIAQKPESGGIDPNHLMIDLRTDDNVKEVKW